jgi:ribonuclease P protein subunit POP4
VDNPNQSLVGLAGRIVDETRNTLLIDAKGSEKRVPKDNTKFIFVLPDGRRVKLSGSILISQPENRIHKKMRKARWKV